MRFPPFLLQGEEKEMDVSCCFIKEQYFIDHSNFQKMLDPGDTEKQSKRTYLCVKITSDSNDYYLPLRNNLGADVRLFGRIGHSIPSSMRPHAGLDYRYALIVNDESYIEIPTTQKIPNIQLQKIVGDYENIVAEFSLYLKGFNKAAKKTRIDREPLYRESSLINFVQEMHVEVQ